MSVLRMKRAIVCAVVVCSLIIIPCASFGKGLTGFIGVELGMPSSEVYERLKQRVGDDDVLKLRNGLSFSVRDSKYFRHATCSFNKDGILREIALTMREVLGVKRVLKGLNKAYKLDLAADRTVIHEGMALRVRGNTIYIQPAETVSLKAVSKKDVHK